MNITSGPNMNSGKTLIQSKTPNIKEGQINNRSSARTPISNTAQALCWNWPEIKNSARVPISCTARGPVLVLARNKELCKGSDQ